MATRFLELSNSSNWNLIYAGEATAEAGNYRNSFIPIGDRVVSLQLDKPILAALVDSNEAKPYWKSAGYLVQKMITGITVGGLPDARLDKRYRLYRGGLQLILLPQVRGDYSITFEVPFWFSHWQGFLWEYLGSDTDSVADKLDELANAIAAVSSDLTTLQNDFDAYTGM